MTSLDGLPLEAYDSGLSLADCTDELRAATGMPRVNVYRFGFDVNADEWELSVILSPGHHIHAQALTVRKALDDLIEQARRTLRDPPPMPEPPPKPGPGQLDIFGREIPPAFPVEENPQP